MAVNVDLTGHNDASLARDKYLDSFDNSTKQSIRIDLEMTAVPVLLGICFLVGITTNGALFYTICKAKKFRNVPNSFLLNIAIANLLMLLICPPMIATSYVLDKRWPFGEIGCKMIYAIPQGALAISMLSLVALSIERYVAFAAPPRHRTSAKNQAFIGNLAIWIIGAICGLPLAIFAYEEISFPVDTNGKEGDKINRCKVFNLDVWPTLAPKAHTVISLVFLFLLPILFCLIFYLSLSCVVCGKKQKENKAAAYDDSTLLKSGSRSNRSGTFTKTTSSNTKTNTLRTVDSRASMPGTLKKSVRKRRTMAKVALFLMVQFTLLWAPTWAHTLRWYFSFEQEDLYWYLIHLIGVVSVYFNAALTPFTVVIFSKSFKHQLGKYFCCCCSCIHCCTCCEKEEKPELPPGSDSDILEKPEPRKRCRAVCCSHSEAEEDSDMNSEPSKGVVDSPSYIQNDASNLYQELPGQSFYDSFTLPVTRPQYDSNARYATINKPRHEAPNSYTLNPSSIMVSTVDHPAYAAASYNEEDLASPYAQQAFYYYDHPEFNGDPQSYQYTSEPLLHAQPPKYSRIFMPSRIPQVEQATSIREIPAI